MDEPKDFSFAYLFKYMWRYLLALVLCVAIGASVGVLFAVRKSTTNIEQYTGSLAVDAMQYTALMAPTQDVNSPKDYALYSAQLSQIIEVACAPEVSAATFVALQDRLYPTAHSIDDKIEQFNKHLAVSRGTNSLTVNFTYDIDNEETDRALAREVVSTYLANAKANIEHNYPLFTDHELIILRDTEQTYAFSEGSLSTNRSPSSFLYAAIGAVVGFVLGVGLLFLAFLFDPRVKTVSDLLPEDRCAVVNADKDTAVVDFVAAVKSAGAKKLLIAAPVDDAELEPFADKICELLGTGEKKVSKVIFTREDSAWSRYFDAPANEQSDYEIYLCRNVSNGPVGYIGRQVDAAAIFADQKKVMSRKLKESVESLKDCRYLCTVIHNAGRAYLD